MSKKIIEVAALDITLYYFALPLMNKLRAAGWKVSAASGEAGYSQKISSTGYRFTPVPFVRNLSPLKNLAAIFSLIRLFKKECPDAVHTHTPIASFLVRIAARIMGVPNVFYTLHGLKTQPFFMLAEKFACKHLTDFIFAVNPHDYKILVDDWKIPISKIKLINGVGIDDKRFSRENVRGKPQSKEAVLGFVGRLTREKGIIELIDAFAELRKKFNCRLIIVGSNSFGERDTHTLNYIKQKIVSENISEFVTFAGHTDDIPRMLSQMNIFILPSYIEGMCVSVLEAMAMELPVVATDIRGIREEVTAETGILVPVRDSHAVAEACEYLLNNPAEAERMGKNGRKRVIELFNQDTILNIQMEVFNEYWEA